MHGEKEGGAGGEGRGRERVGGNESARMGWEAVRLGGGEQCWVES